MAKKNVYSSLDYDVIKKELASTMKYLRSIKAEGLEDDIDFVTTIKGGVMPQMVSSIEKKLQTMIIVIFDFVSQLEVIYKLEGITDFLAKNIDDIRKKLNEVQKYYLKRDPSKLVHRYNYVEFGHKADGTPKTNKLKCATKEEQIRCRSDVQKKVLQILPKLSVLESAKAEIELKGGKDIPPSLVGYI